MARIAVDAMGSDRDPDEIVAGALEARADGIEPILFGDPSLDPHGLELHETSSVIGMDESAAEAVRAKPESSLVQSVRALEVGVDFRFDRPARLLIVRSPQRQQLHRARGAGGSCNRGECSYALEAEADPQSGRTPDRLRSVREGRVCGVVSCTRARTDGRGPGEPEPLSF